MTVISGLGGDDDRTSSRPGGELTSIVKPPRRKVRRRKKQPNRPRVPGPDPFDFRQPLSPDLARKELAAMIGLQYGPATEALEQRKSDVPRWFADYKREIAAMQTAQNQRFNTGVADIERRGTAAQQASANTIAQVQAGNQGDAASRGATANNQVNVDAANAAAIRQQGTNAAADLLRTQGLANDAYFSSQATNADLMQVQELNEVAKAIELLRSEKGAAAVKFLGELRERERRYDLERKAFGLEQQKFTESQRPQPLTPSEQKTLTELGYLDEHGYYPGRGAPAKPKKVKPKKDEKTASTIRRAVRAVTRHDNGLDTYWQEAFNTLVEEDGLDPIVARAVVQGARVGRLGPQTKKRLWQIYGLRPEDLGFPTPRKRPTPHTLPDDFRTDAASP